MTKIESMLYLRHLTDLHEVLIPVKIMKVELHV